MRLLIQVFLFIAVPSLFRLGPVLRILVLPLLTSCGIYESPGRKQFEDDPRTNTQLATKKSINNLSDDQTSANPEIPPVETLNENRYFTTEGCYILDSQAQLRSIQKSSLIHPTTQGVTEVCPL